MEIQNIDQCDYCTSPAIFKVTNASKSEESISCKLHKKNALESMSKVSEDK